MFSSMNDSQYTVHFNDCWLSGVILSTINFNCLSNQEVAKSETLEEYDPPAEDLTVALLQNLVIVCCTISLQLLHDTLYVYGLVSYNYGTLHFWSYSCYMNDYPTTYTQMTTISTWGMVGQLLPSLRPRSLFKVSTISGFPYCCPIAGWTGIKSFKHLFLCSFAHQRQLKELL